MLSEVYSTTRSTRRTALDRLAALAAGSADGNDEVETDIAKLCTLGRGGSWAHSNGSLDESADRTRPTASIPMTIRELEVLIALCKAAPLVQTTQDASKLLRQLTPYVAEAHQQVFTASPVHQNLPPWETLSYDVTTAVLALGLNHPSLRPTVWACIDETIAALLKSAEKAPQNQLVLNTQSLQALQLAVSLLGFLNAIAKYIRTWSPDQYPTLIPRLRKILSNDYLLWVEGVINAVETHPGLRLTREWRRWLSIYAAKSQPLGAMSLQLAFMQVAEEGILSILAPQQPVSSDRVLDVLLERGPNVFRSTTQVAEGIVSKMKSIIADEMRFLEGEMSFLRIDSIWQHPLAREITASGLRSSLCCTVLDEDSGSSDALMDWLDIIAADPVQFTDSNLAQSVLKSMAVVATLSESVAFDLTQSLPRLLVRGRMSLETASVAGECLARVLKPLPQDVIISTVYELGNVLSVSADNATTHKFFLNENASALQQDIHPVESAISLAIHEDADTSVVFSSIVQTIIAIAVARSEAQMTSLIIAMLSQKIGTVNHVLDAKIIIGTATLGLCGRANELRSLLRFYARAGGRAITEHNEPLIRATMEARLRLATWIKKDSPLFEVYLVHLLCLSLGTVDTIVETSPGHTTDVALTSKTIAQLLRPLALLVSADTENKPHFRDLDDIRSLSRDAWFNLVVHGFTLTSTATREYADELQTIAQYSLPLVHDAHVDMPQSSLTLNPVLQRGAGSQQLAQQKQSLIAVLSSCEHEIKGLSYPECVFLNAALMVSTMRARSGDCTAVLQYFLEKQVKTTSLGKCMLAVANQSVDTYLRRALAGKEQHFAAPQIALQLAAFFQGCCHRIAKVQEAARSACDRIISQIPSALCQKASLFALLELLSLMWKSCLDTETDEYDWKSDYSSVKGNVSLKLSDDVDFRHTTLKTFHRSCRAWVVKAIEIAPLDVKGLLQAYLQDYEDDGAYGHIALGRTFAVEMGSIIPSSDQRLTSLDRQRDVGVNTASDFFAQYTTRQEYRNPDTKRGFDEEWALVDYSGAAQPALVDAESPVEDEAAELRELAERLLERKHVPFHYVRNTLRNAAGALSRYKTDGSALIQDLVAIPFIIFTKQSINLGISLWLGVVKENPSLESRILVEVAAGWEASIRRKKGFFNPHFKHLDPFYIKEEFAPSDWEAISKRLQMTQNLIAPHLRLTHFLSSHFTASRLTSPSIEQIYARLMRVTLLSMGKTVNQPLAREVHFHIIFLALKVLRYGTNVHAPAQWRLKDAILTAALSWFKMPPRWSFGSNKLQVKAEAKLLGDVALLLRGLSAIGSKATKGLPSLSARQELLLQLIRHEVERLQVWINPLASEARALTSGAESVVTDATMLVHLKSAWAEDPRIAIQLAARFPNSQRLAFEIRQYLLREPEKAIGEPDALDILLHAELPADVQSQLKYLLFWAPINPMAAVTYFLPAYKNHPFIIQYAVRALESHSVDITFFYVPQIVQTLRYDSLGYVERYIVETAKFSQLFAHQIIWNMKANAFKDEESQEPDSVKPVLDKVMAALISSFSAEDKDFYEREFDFFGKVTGISGILKPFIKRPKPEKKAKIEEELRKIEVDVGVYLPSNPDGVVIGIDRQSGRPLQSHAKAPYMATFRIRKEEGDPDSIENEVAADGQVAQRKTYEVWQSAIFKVGDDCRQDVLALQLIAAFRGIFNSVGLDVYVFPYRVTATAPGCGVIDVLPNSISRDMIGREAVNGLYEYFVSQYGYEDSLRFQEARSNFIKSMAAYSIISYLLQFKDRHNGNIMVDDAGHILHIDFGFCFDIAPGGVKFERAPFKLTPEMLAVMGGSTNSRPFKAFEELCVKVFLASRQYVEQLAHIVSTMLDSGLPCFKPTTLQHFKERFVLEKTDREAADFVRKLIHWSEKSYSTGVYDYYQLLTNGIPY